MAGPAVWAIAIAAQYVAGLGSLDRVTAQPQAFALLVIAYPVVEEWLFRGQLQPAIAARITVRALPGISAANFLTSTLFALAHLPFHAPPHALATFFPSLVFGFFRDRYASVVPGLLLHIWYNAGFFLLSAPRLS